MPAPQKIIELVKKFADNFDYYQESDFNEEDLRSVFLDPFFTELGWDMNDEKGLAANREVRREKRQESGYPDYAFYIDGHEKFFVEAKNPSEKVCNNQGYAFQLRSYGYSAGVARSILTDFEEFSIYVTGTRPKENDPARTAREQCIHYTEYVDRWDEIESIFSRKAVAEGSLDRLDKRRGRGRQAVDNDLLADISKWREWLAKNIAIRNKSLDVEPLNWLVQDTLNRILFLRICEDRNIGEEYGQLRRVVQEDGVYTRLWRVFEKARQRYDSGLFELNRLPSIEIDDKTLRDIVSELYLPKSPYRFDAVPADILGKVYEQFLGKVIRLTEDHHAKVEDKPEVKHGKGVYYTPTYIVDYIVKQAVGKLLKDKTPKNIGPFSVVDPACGSGSFLLGAYQFLMDWYLDRYVEHEPNRQEKNKLIYLDQFGQYRLTLDERKRILTTHIFGVDIDRQAVEVTKLSLMLKALEAPEQRSLFNDRILPNLADNIKWGNSLIGTDYFDDKPDARGEERTLINPFNWRDGFPEVFRRDGFDVVIGNPPYVRQELLGGDKAYFEKAYKVFAGSADLYSYFIERGVDILRPGGHFCYIVANKWMRAAYGEPLRRWLKTQQLEEITDFGDLQIFENATTYTCILRISKGEPETTLQAAQVKTLDIANLSKHVRSVSYPVSVSSLSNDGWSLADESSQKLLAKIRSGGVPLGKYGEDKIFRGVLTGMNEAFIIDRAVRDQLTKEDPKSTELIKPFLLGRDIKRYEQPVAEQYLIFTRRGTDIARYPAIERHLTQFRAALTPKPKDWKGKKWTGRKGGNYKWYEIQDSVEYWQEFEKSKIIYPNICSKPQFTFDDRGFYTNQKCFLISLSDKYLLGVLNSSVTAFLFRTVLPKLRGGYYEPSYVYLKEFPIFPAESEQQEPIIELVNSCMSLNDELVATHVESERLALRRQIDAIDRRIDQIVYKLYGLTDEEIRIVEESIKS